jgi:hypothetical protein
MLRSAGFEIISHPEREVFICRRIEPSVPLRDEDKPWLKR